jgi:fibro-slime domain-containing protein
MNRRIYCALLAAVLPWGCSNGAGESASHDSGTAGAPGTSTGGNGSGGSGGSDIILPDAGNGSSGSGGPTSGALVAIIRDFRLYSAGDPTTNPDFENVPKTDQNGNPNDTYLGPWNDTEIVTDTLGADGKPVYKSAGQTLCTHGKAAFDQWYRDVPGTNLRVEYPIVLSGGNGAAYEYDSEKTGVPFGNGDPVKMFFPIDDGSKYATAFGHQGDAHNYAFTVELHTSFTYKGGEFFNFRGDDDVFVYIDGKLVINLGGIHGPETAQVNLDSLGLTKGSLHTLDFFSAERHKGGSNILFTTTLGLQPVTPK